MRTSAENPELVLACVWSAAPEPALAVVGAPAVCQVTSWCWDSREVSGQVRAQSLGAHGQGGKALEGPRELRQLLKEPEKSRVVTGPFCVGAPGSHLLVQGQGASCPCRGWSPGL